jgi:anti-anti-sigma factor
MGAACSVIQGCREGDVARLRVTGRAVAHQCPAGRQFAVDAVPSGARRVLVELSECEYSDSTFMGTLLQIRKAADQCGQTTLCLVSPSPEFLATLQTMGLKRLFQLSDEVLPREGAWRELCVEQPGTRSLDFKENVVAAHRELSEASETCAQRYRLILEEATKELEQGRARSS